MSANIYFNKNIISDFLKLSQIDFRMRGCNDYSRVNGFHARDVRLGETFLNDVVTKLSPYIKWALYAAAIDKFRLTEIGGYVEFKQIEFMNITLIPNFSGTNDFKFEISRCPWSFPLLAHSDMHDAVQRVSDIFSGEIVVDIDSVMCVKTPNGKPIDGYNDYSLPARFTLNLILQNMQNVIDFTPMYINE
ncbi:hypothetical protein [Microcystis phage Mel-JY01]